MSAPFLLVSVHDVAPATCSATRRWTQLLAAAGVPLTFLAVPVLGGGNGFHDVGDDGTDLGDWLRRRQRVGDEICLHGWSHRAGAHGSRWRRAVGSVVARGAAEFWDLDRATARTRAQEGLRVLEEQGLSVRGITPPGWLASAQSRRGLADAGLSYTTDHAGVIHLPSGRRWLAPALCHRPVFGPAPVNESPDEPVNGPVTEPTKRAATAAEDLGRRVVAGSWRIVAAGGSVRIGLHPDDLRRPRLVETTIAAVHRCLAEGARPITYGRLLQRFGSAS